MTDFILGFIKWFLLLLCFLFLSGLLFEYFSRWRLERKVFHRKTFVNISGKRIHYIKKGKGKCTIVFVSGMGSTQSIWQEIQQKLSSEAVTISYDRNGIGLSEDNGPLISNDLVSEELQVLLEKTGCTKPFIVVAHSMAGIYIRPFLEKHKNNIAGLILVDSAHPLQLKKASPQLLKALAFPSPWLIRFAVRSGLYRILYSFMPMSAELSIQHPVHQQNRDFFYRSYKKTIEELQQDKENFKKAEKYTSFGNIPLSIISGTSEIRFSNIKDKAIKKEYRIWWNHLQMDLLNLSSKSTFVKATNSGHLVPVNDSELLIQEIKKHLF